MATKKTGYETPTPATDKKKALQTALAQMEKTFGKGIMQSTMPLGDGSAVRVTVAKFYTKSGTEFHGVGLAPDREVKIDQSTSSRFLLDDSDEPVIQAAIDYLDSVK